MKEIVCAVLSAMMIVSFISCDMKKRPAERADNTSEIPESISETPQTEPTYKVLDLTKHGRQEVIYVTGDDLKELFVLAADYYRDYDEITGEIIVESTRNSSEVRRETVTVLTGRGSKEKTDYVPASDEAMISEYVSIAEIFMMNVNLFCSSDIIFSEYSGRESVDELESGFRSYGFPFAIGLKLYEGERFRMSPMEIMIRDSITFAASLGITVTESGEYALLFASSDTGLVYLTISEEGPVLTEEK